MITIFFDEASNKPLYEQLYSQLKEMILTSVLVAHDKLPSKRNLSTHLKCSQITVETAYLQLMAEGYIISKPRSGYFVEEIDPKFHINKKFEYTRPNIETDKYQFDLKTNMVDEEHFPYVLWNKVMREVYQLEYKALLNDIPPEGYYPLREQISKYVASFRGINVNPDQIIIGSGSDYLLHIITLLVGEGKQYLIENPSFVKTKKLYDSFKCIVRYARMDEFGMRMDDIYSSQSSVVHVSPSHQFPTGIIMPYARRIELLKWANESDEHYIIEDDYDSEFRFIGNPIPALKGLDQFDKVIYMNSFSKSLSPTKRVSFMILPLKLLNIYHEQYSFFANPVTMSEQIGLSLFMKDGHFERHLNRMKQLYKTKRDYFIETLKSSKLRNMIDIEGETAGLHFIVKFPSYFDHNQIIIKAKEQGIRLYSIIEYHFDVSNETENKFIFGYAHLTKEEIATIVLRLERVITDVSIKKTNN